MSVAERCPCCGQIGVVTRRPSWAFTERSSEPRYTLTEVMDAFTGAWSDWSRPWHARTLAELFSFRLRSGGATTEMGGDDQ
jgi:hypothetical protein